MSVLLDLEKLLNFKEMTEEAFMATPWKAKYKIAIEEELHPSNCLYG